MWIERIVGQQLLSLAQSFPVVVLTGPRQVGKTALLEHTFPDYRYVSLDVLQNAEAAESRPNEFIAQSGPPVIIDEIQYAPQLLRYIKTFVDEHRGDKGLFLITGSQSFPLMQGVAESLAGRAAVIPLLGLSMIEWSRSVELTSAFEPTELFWRGSFPAIWEHPQLVPDRNRWYQGYVATYLERDIRNMLNVSNLRDFERFLRSCAARVGQILNMSELARDVGISPTTARQWLGLLHASNQLLLLEPYYRNCGKRITKSPKLYFTDTGLAAYLAGFDSYDALAASPLGGAFWENHVVSQWYRWKDWSAPSAGLWFWQDRSRNEIDLLIELNQKLYAVECKRKERPDARDAQGLVSLRSMFGEEVVAHSFMACLARQNYEIGDGVTAMNGWQTWELP